MMPADVLDLADGARVYLAAGATDMRKSIDSLAAEVQESMHLDPFSSCLFAFCSRRKDKVKILFWEHNGFWLCYRRLERGTFRWPQTGDGGTVTVTRRELRWLLDGLELDLKGGASGKASVSCGCKSRPGKLGSQVANSPGSIGRPVSRSREGARSRSVTSK